MSAAIPNLPLAAPYPVQLTVDPPDDARNRLTVGLRFVWVLPALPVGRLNR